jgi:hypothetical protein
LFGVRRIGNTVTESATVTEGPDSALSRGCLAGVPPNAGRKSPALSDLCNGRAVSVDIEEGSLGLESSSPGTRLRCT